MSSLPAEVDFTLDAAATSARMDRAMAFLVAWLRRVESVQPDFLAVTADLKTVGLSRLDEVLSPIFLDAQDISAQLAAIRSAWLTGQPLTQLLNDLSAQVTGRLAAVDGRLGDVDARLAANLASVTTQLGNNTTAVNAQLAANTNSVGNQLAAQNTSVDAKLASLSPTAKWAEASTAEARAGTASRLISAAVLWAMQAPVLLVDAPTIALDLGSGGENYAVTIGANRVLGNPTGGRAGQQGSIFVTQDATGGRVLSFGANYVPDDLLTYPQLNTPSGAVTELRYKVAPDGKVRIFGGKPSGGLREQDLYMYSDTNNVRVVGTWINDTGTTQTLKLSAISQNGIFVSRTNLSSGTTTNFGSYPVGSSPTLTLPANERMNVFADVSSGNAYVKVKQQ